MHFLNFVSRNFALQGDLCHRQSSEQQKNTQQNPRIQFPIYSSNGKSRGKMESFGELSESLLSSPKDPKHPVEMK